MVESHLGYPFRLDGRGRVATANEDDHVRALIHQVLFTNPGERLNRPDFGSGLQQLVFAPNSDILSTATQFIVQGALQRWLSDVIKVERVKITNDEERLIVEVMYVRLDTGERRVDAFSSEGGA